MIHIYRSELSCVELSSCFQDLPWNRKERIVRLKTHEAKLRVAGTYLLLKEALQKEGVDGIELVEHENGKPYLKDFGLYFSLSASGNLLVCAVSDSEVGADCQRIGVVDERTAERFYSMEERKIVAKSAEPGLVSALIWTRKESLLKFTGEGLSVLLDGFSVFPDRRISYKGDSYNMYDYMLDDYVLSVCSQQKCFPETIHRLDIGKKDLI